MSLHPKEVENFGDSVSEVETTLKKKGITWDAVMLMKVPRKDEELMSAYRGKHIAIIGNKIVGSGSSAYSVWKTAKKKYPGKRPVLAFVSKKCAALVKAEYRL